MRTFQTITSTFTYANDEEGEGSRVHLYDQHASRELNRPGDSVARPQARAKYNLVPWQSLRRGQRLWAMAMVSCEHPSSILLPWAMAIVSGGARTSSYIDFSISFQLRGSDGLV